MTRSATIVSFDEAKRSSRRARSRALRDQREESSVEDLPLAYFDPGSDARFSAPSQGRRAAARRTAFAFGQGTSRVAPASAPGARRSEPAAGSGARRLRAASATSERKAPLHAVSAGSRPTSSRFNDGSGSRQGRLSAGRRNAPSWYDGPDERALGEERARRVQVREEAREIEDEQQRKENVPLAQRLRRAVAKRKADRLFGRQGAGSGDGAAAAGEGGPRAAVYRGEMGSSQRRASRMQGSPDAEGEAKRSRGLRRFSFGPKLRIVAASAACLALVCVFLYQPARQYYQEMRAHDAAALEYDALQQRQSALQQSVDTLSTEEGMQDLAHEQYGLVRKGETAVSVAGVEDTSDDGDAIPPNVAANSIDPPDTWYSGVLDPLFGVN